MGNSLWRKNMRLTQILKGVFENNKKARRKNWLPVHFISMRDEKLSLFLEDGEHHPWLITLPDIEAIDWELL